MENSGKPQLYYWNIRGLGSYICMAFFAADKDFDLIEYSADTEDDWFGRDKPALTMTLPNLPYLRDGHLEISEHDAIFRHVLRKYQPDLLGNNVDEQGEIDQFITFWAKTNVNMRMWCYSDASKDGSDATRIAKLDEFKYQFERINQRLEKSKYLVGETMTGADIFFYDTFLIMETIHAETAHKYANIHRVKKDVESTPWYQTYKSSNKWHTQLNWHDANVNNALEK